MQLFDLVCHYTVNQIKSVIDPNNSADKIFDTHTTSWLQNSYRINQVDDIKTCLQYFQNLNLSENLRSLINLLINNNLNIIVMIYQSAFNAMPIPINQLTSAEKDRLYALTLNDLNRQGEEGLFCNSQKCKQRFTDINDIKKYFCHANINDPILLEYLSLYCNAEFLLAIGVEAQSKLIEKGLILVEERAQLAELSPITFAERAAQKAAATVGAWLYSQDETLQERRVEIATITMNTLLVTIKVPYHKYLLISKGTIHLFDPPFIICTSFKLESQNSNVFLSELTQQYINKQVLPVAYQLSPAFQRATSDSALVTHVIEPTVRESQSAPASRSGSPLLPPPHNTPLTQISSSSNTPFGTPLTTTPFATPCASPMRPPSTQQSRSRLNST